MKDIISNKGEKLGTENDCGTISQKAVEEMMEEAFKVGSKIDVHNVPQQTIDAINKIFEAEI